MFSEDFMDKTHLVKIIDLLYKECISAGGDGDALWYSKYYQINTLLPLVEEYNNDLNYPFEIIMRDNSIHWGKGQEWIIITNDESVYNNCPKWAQFVLRN